MQFIKTPVEGAFLLKPETYMDRRGAFSRLYCKSEFSKIGHYKEIVQVNHSITHTKGSVRGMHFQKPPKSETKIVKCIKGAVFDVMVDIRKNSPTFLKWHGEVISAENMHMVYIPDGFAHGFQTLEPTCELLYFHTQFYSPEYEDGLRFDEPKVGIQWPEEVTEISEKDKKHRLLSDSFDGLKIL